MVEFEKYVCQLKSDVNTQIDYSGDFVKDSNFVHIIDDTQHELDDEEGCFEIVYYGKNIEEFEECMIQLQTKYDKITYSIGKIN